MEMSASTLITLYNQYDIFIKNILSAFKLNKLLNECPKLNSPVGSVSCLVCVHTKYSVEPGKYSQRNTALPRKDK